MELSNEYPSQGTPMDVEDHPTNNLPARQMQQHLDYNPDDYKRIGTILREDGPSGAAAMRDKAGNK